MKTKNIVVVTLGLTVIGLVGQVFSNKAGAPAGHTNSPADAKTCSKSGCHSGVSPIPISGNVLTSDIPAEGYTPGATYNFTLSHRRPGHTRYGFQVSPQNAAGTQLGTLINSAATAFSSGSTKYITHKSSSMDFPSTGTATWDFQWTAPAAGTGPVNFYGAINASNNNQTASGDTILYFSQSIQENTSVGLAKNTVSASNKFKVSYRENGLNIFLNNWYDFPFEVTVYDLNARKLVHKKFTDENQKEILINNIPVKSEILFVHLINEEGTIFTQKVITGVN